METVQGKDQSQVDALQALVLSPELERLEDLLAEFNPFELLGIERREAQHSKLLAWLLDPRGSHGLRDYFLRRFLSEAASGIAEVTPLDVDGWKLSDIEVATERHNIDILLVSENDGFVCLIENKIGSGEGPGQLSRYLDTVNNEYEGLTPLPIFLTPEGREPDDDDDVEDWAAFGYEAVVGLIDRTLERRGSTINAGVAGFLEQYARTIGRHVLSTTDNIGELAREIYNNHRAAIDLIIEAKSGLQDQGWDVIEAAVAQYEPLLEADFHQKEYHRFYSPELDEIPELKQGTGWTKSGRMLLFEFRYHAMSLNLVLGPGPEETRQRVYDLVQGEDRVPGVSVNRAELRRKWSSVYVKPLTKEPRSSEPDYKKARPQVEQAIAEFYEKDYWPIVNAIRGEFGLPPVSP